MRTLFRLVVLGVVVLAGGVVLIRLRYNTSWRESLGIAEQFVEDLIP